MIKANVFIAFARRLIGTIFFLFFFLYFLAFFLRNQLGLFCQLKHLRGNHKLRIVYTQYMYTYVHIPLSHTLRSMFVYLNVLLSSLALA